MIHVYEAATFATAVEYASEDLGLSRKNIPIVKVVKRGGVAFFSGRKRVEVVVKIESKLERMIIDFVERTLSYMNCPARAEVSHRENDRVWIHIRADRAGILIGRRGKNLDALQHLASVFSKRHTEEGFSVILDVKHYRYRRIRQVEQLARRAAQRVLHNGSSYLLEPMSAYERHIVHEVVRPLKRVTTQSEGEGARRRVRVLSDEQ